MFFFKETKENFQVINRHLRGCSYSIPLFTDVFQGLDVKGGFFMNLWLKLNTQVMITPREQI